MKVVVATANAGKLREFERIFTPLGIEVIGQQQVCPELSVEENGTTFAENAFLKAQAVHQLTGLAAVADDSGLCVDALGGNPGVYSARYGGDVSYPEKMAMLLKEIEGIEAQKRGAQFVAHICYIDPQGNRVDIEEACHGSIGFSPRGEKGFGFDPIFMVGARSFSELSDAEKDSISHRGKALRKLAEYLNQTNDK